MKLVIGAIVLVIGLLAFSSIYSNSRGLSAGTPSPIGGHGRAALSRPAPSVSSGNHNRIAPAFSLDKLDGGTITLSQYKGEKPVILDFFATWCPNCRRDMPQLSKLYEEKYKDQVEVIGINLRENESTVRDFIESRGISFPIALDPASEASRLYGIRYTNTHVLVDKAGNIVREIPGDIRESDIKSLIGS